MMIDRLNSYTVLASFKGAARMKDYLLEAPDVALRERQEGRKSLEAAGKVGPVRDIEPTKLVSNPHFIFNKDLGRVVVEFHDAESGEVRRQIPTKGQIEAYQGVKIQKSEVGNEKSEAREVDVSDSRAREDVEAVARHDVLV